MSDDKGFSLIELIIAIFLSMLVLSAIYTVFFGSNKASTMQTQDNAMQDNARMAMDVLCRNLRMAGYLVDFSKYPPGTQIDGLTSKLTYSNHNDGPDSVTMVGSSSTAVKMYYSASKGDTTITLDDVSGISMGTVINIGLTQTTTASSAPNTSTKTVTLSAPLNMDYPGMYVHSGGADVPSGKTPTVVSFATANNFAIDSMTDPAHPALAQGGIALAENIEDLQFRYGVDPNGNNKITWTSDPLSIFPNIEKVKLVEISLVARTAAEDPALKETIRSVPQLGDRPQRQVIDGYRRYILTRTVKLRNMSVMTIL